MQRRFPTKQVTLAHLPIHCQFGPHSTIARTRYGFASNNLRILHDYVQPSYEIDSQLFFFFCPHPFAHETFLVSGFFFVTVPI